MATWKCLCCEALYMAPKDWGGLVPHACPPRRDRPGGRGRERPGHRDENMHQDRATGIVTMRRAGAGRILLDEGDVLVDLTPETLADLRARPALGPTPYPEPTPRVPTVWPSRGSNW